MSHAVTQQPVATVTVDLHDTDALRTVETRAAAELGNDYALMQRAGEAAWRHVLRHWPQAQRIVVACGPGNNGGDGYMLARHAQQAGRKVLVLRAQAPRSKLAQRACAEYEAAGGRSEAASSAVGDLDPAEVDLVVDALLGIGLSRAPDPDIAGLIEIINALHAPVLALDVPSGIDADRGSAPGIAVRAIRTLQLIAAHPGLVTGAALDHVGILDLATLDLDRSLLQSMPACATALAADALNDWLPPRARNSHKGNNGHVLCVGGDHGSGGAIVLCAQAALRSGAGLVSVATRTAHVAALLARCPEAMSHGFDSTDALAQLAERADVIAIGPGLGKSAWAEAMLDVSLASGKAFLLDADALNLLARTPRALPDDTILTPHPGEAARLLGCETTQIQADRYAAATALVARYGCVVVLKGAGTIVAAPQCTPYVIAAGNPGMAVGGMGDLLSGVIASLRAQGIGHRALAHSMPTKSMAALAAAACGALLHAAAGDAAAADGQRGMQPSDLLPQLRRLANPQNTWTEHSQSCGN